MTSALQVPRQGDIVVPRERDGDFTVLSVADYTGAPSVGDEVGWLVQVVETWVAEDMTGRGWSLSDLSRMTGHPVLSRDDVAEVRPTKA